MFVLMIKGIKVYEGEVTPSNMRFKDTKFLQNQIFDLVLIGVTVQRHGILLLLFGNDACKNNKIIIMING